MLAVYAKCLAYARTCLLGAGKKPEKARRRKRKRAKKKKMRQREWEAEQERALFASLFVETRVRVRVVCVRRCVYVRVARDRRNFCCPANREVCNSCYRVTGSHERPVTSYHRAGGGCRRPLDGVGQVHHAYDNISAPLQFRSASNCTPSGPVLLRLILLKPSPPPPLAIRCTLAVPRIPRSTFLFLRLCLTAFIPPFSPPFKQTRLPSSFPLAFVNITNPCGCSNGSPCACCLRDCHRRHWHASVTCAALSWCAVDGGISSSRPSRDTQWSCRRGCWRRICYSAPGRFFTFAPVWSRHFDGWA